MLSPAPSEPLLGSPLAFLQFLFHPRPPLGHSFFLETGPPDSPPPACPLTTRGSGEQERTELEGWLNPGSAAY